MKQVTKNTVTTIIIVLTALVLFGNTSTYAQDNKFDFNKTALVNLESGIQSDNEGLRSSSIYLAGLYKVTEMVDILTTQLKTEQKPKMKILIALSLFHIGDESGMEAVNDLSATASDESVKRMASLLYYEYKTGEFHYATANTFTK